MAYVNDWNYRANNVGQLTPNDYIGKFIEGETILLAAGPPVYDPDSMDDIAQMHVIGMTQQVGITEGKQIQRVFEIGSRKGFLVPGRAAGSMVISKIWANSDSLLGSLYREVATDQEPFYREPGYNYKFTNLQSELFNYPIGILMMIHDQNDDMVAASFFECCYVNSRNWGVSAQGVVTAENVRIDYEEQYPIDPGVIATEE